MPPMQYVYIFVDICPNCLSCLFTALIYIFFYIFFSAISNAQAILVQCQKLKVELHAKPNSQIHNPHKNAYHQSKGTPGKTSLDKVYSLDLICNESLMSPGWALLEYNKKGAVIKMSIEIQFNVPVGYLNNTDQLPTGSVVRLEFIPSNHYIGSLCEGKPTVLLRAVIEANFTLQNVQNGTFHDFQQGPIDHTKCFYSGIKKLTRNLLDIRPNHATFNSCKIAVCYCKNTTSTQPGGVGGHPANWGNPGPSAQIGNPGPLPPPGAIGGPSPHGGNQALPTQGANQGPVPQQGAVRGPSPHGGNQAPPTQGANSGPVPQQGAVGGPSPREEINHLPPKVQTMDLSPNKGQLGHLPPREEIKHFPPKVQTRDLSPNKGQLGDLPLREEIKHLPPKVQTLDLSPNKGQLGDLPPREEIKHLPPKVQTMDPSPNQGQLVTISTNKRKILDVSTEKSQNKKIIDGKLTYIDDGKSTEIEKSP